MNKSNIEWCDYTWNPVTGCLHGCPYCYARRIANRFKGGKAFPNGFKPTFRPERLSQPAKVKEPSKVFVGSMTDLFGEWVPKEWIESVMQVVEDCPQHTFIFLTKNPSRYKNCLFSDNAWVGCSITHLDGIKTIGLNVLKAKTKFVSIEPLLSGPTSDIVLQGIDWVIVGAQTGPGAVKPKTEWVQAIIQQCRKADVPIFLKDNLKWPEEIKEWPRG